MKIFVATGIFPPDIGGPATYSKLLFDELPKRGIEVVVLSFGEVRKLPKGIRHFIYFFKLLGRARGADVIFAQDTVSVGLPSLWASKVLGKRFFVRVPGDHAWEQAVQRYGVTDSIDEFQNKKYGRGVEFLRKIARKTVNGAEKVITPSMYFRDLVSKWVRDPNKVYCTYNGIDLSQIPESTGTFEPKTIISAGRLVPWKGFDGLIKSLQQLLEWKLSIAGDGSDRRELEKLAQSVGVADRVLFLGQIPRRELIVKIQESEVFVLNTSYESFSFQVVEAMAAGTPVITTNIGNLSEIIDDRENGILVAPDDTKAIADAIDRLSSNKELRNKIITRAKEKAKQFSISYTLDNLITLLKKP